MKPLFWADWYNYPVLLCSTDSLISIAVGYSGSVDRLKQKYPVMDLVNPLPGIAYTAFIIP